MTESRFVHVNTPFDKDFEKHPSAFGKIFEQYFQVQG
jgi:hypothetical protein